MKDASKEKCVALEHDLNHYNERLEFYGSLYNDYIN